MLTRPFVLPESVRNFGDYFINARVDDMVAALGYSLKPVGWSCRA
jgi:hypothetical protein